MPITFGELKSTLRRQAWPEGEPPNLVEAHNKMFVDALNDLQEWVDCFQLSNCDVVPQCSTYYRSGLTYFPKPYGKILRVGVIDGADWDSFVPYMEVAAADMRRYMTLCKQHRCVLPIASFWCIDPVRCPKGHYPTPTNEGLPEGFIAPPLGFSYPQESTDKTWRSTNGVYTIDDSNLVVGPWINSTESVVVWWEGKKRSWADTDAVNDDPTFTMAVLEWLMWKHNSLYEQNFQAAQDYERSYARSLASLQHDCREATRLRDADAAESTKKSSGLEYLFSSSPGGGGGDGTGTLYYNTESKSYTANCVAPQTGDSKTAYVAAGTVSSPVSVDDANDRAEAKAQADAIAMLNCSQQQGETFGNFAVTLTWTGCPDHAEDHPAPTCNEDYTGCAHEITIPENTVFSNESRAEATAIAEEQALQQMREAVQCVYYNKEITVTVPCPQGTTEVTPGIATVDAGEVSSTLSEADADAQARAIALAYAADIAAGDLDGWTTQTRSCEEEVFNATAAVTKTTVFMYSLRSCFPFPSGAGGTAYTYFQVQVVASATASAYVFNAPSQQEAQLAAQEQAELAATQRANEYVPQLIKSYCASGAGQVINIVVPAFSGSYDYCSLRNCT